MARIWFPYGFATRVLIVASVGVLAVACGSSTPARGSARHIQSSPTSTAGVGTATTSLATRASAQSSIPSSSAPNGSATRNSATTRPNAPVSTTAPKSSNPAATPSNTVAPAVTTTAPPAGTVVSSGTSSSYGAIVTDGSGRTLYLYTPDNGKPSPQCTSSGGCTATWPPLHTSGTPQAEGGALQGLLGTEDGQVTYNGHPLYDFSGDSGPGQTNGEGMGGIWYVVSTSGNPVP